MITYIKGRLIEKSPTKIIVEANGIGYYINISLNTFEKIGDDENITIYTHFYRAVAGIPVEVTNGFSANAI